MRHSDSDTTGRRWAQAGFWLGVAGTIAGNVAHSYVPPTAVVATATRLHRAVEWSPAPGAIVAAAFWPLALLISIEVVSRVQWPAAWYWWVARWIGMTAVAVIAAVISYRHLSAVLAAWGEDGVSSTIGPLAVDGLMVVCSGALIATLPKRSTATPPAMPAPLSQPTEPVAAAVSHAPSVPSVSDTPAPETPAQAIPAARVAAPRQPKPRTRDNDIDKQTARRRVRAGESCAVVAADLKVNKRAVERWTKDIREARQHAATATTAGDSDDAEERVG